MTDYNPAHVMAYVHWHVTLDELNWWYRWCRKPDSLVHSNICKIHNGPRHGYCDCKWGRS